MRRYFEAVIETAGFYNTAGFNDDTHAFLSIPARHDVWRRMACRHLATLVVEHRVDEDEAYLLAHDLAYALAKRAYRLAQRLRPRPSLRARWALGLARLRESASTESIAHSGTNR